MMFSTVMDCLVDSDVFLTGHNIQSRLWNNGSSEEEDRPDSKNQRFPGGPRMARPRIFDGYFGGATDLAISYEISMIDHI